MNEANRPGRKRGTSDRKPEPGSPLGQRLQPVQARARATVETILDAAARLLDEVGLDGFNTNLLAERAGVRVRTVYRYFPNKYAVIVALAERLADLWEQWMADYYRALADPARDWREASIRVRREWLHHARNEPGAVGVLAAINATPELRELDRRIFDELCAKMVTALRARGLDLPRERLMAVARASVSSLNAGVELYFDLNPTDASLLLEELERTQIAYLEPWLEPAGSTESPPGDRSRPPR